MGFSRREAIMGRGVVLGRGAVLALLSLWTLPVATSAKGPGVDAYMIRMLSCEGPDAKMEVYIPQPIALDASGMVRDLQKPVIGYYALDLTPYNKGKPLEPVKVSMTPDGKTVIQSVYPRFAADPHSGGWRHRRLRQTLRLKRQMRPVSGAELTCPS